MGTTLPFHRVGIMTDSGEEPPNTSTIDRRPGTSINLPTCQLDAQSRGLKKRLSRVRGVRASESTDTGSRHEKGGERQHIKKTGRGDEEDWASLVSGL